MTLLRRFKHRSHVSTPRSQRRRRCFDHLVHHVEDHQALGGAALCAAQVAEEQHADSAEQVRVGSDPASRFLDGGAPAAQLCQDFLERLQRLAVALR